MLFSIFCYSDLTFSLSDLLDVTLQTLQLGYDIELFCSLYLHVVKSLNIILHLIFLIFHNSAKIWGTCRDIFRLGDFA